MLVQSGETARMKKMNCQEASPLLNAFADSELAGDERAAVLTHVEGCRECSSRVESIRALKRRLSVAVSAEPPPLGLETRVRARIGPAGAAAPWGLRFSLAAAAIAGWAVVWKPAQQQILAVLGSGADDHVHCTLERKKPAFGELFRPIDPEYKDLAERVAVSMPAGYDLRERHFCRSGGKRFQHFVYEREGRRVSVIVTPKKNAGSFPAVGVLAAKMRANGIPLYSAKVLGLSAAGFESGQNVAFVVSDMDPEENLKVLAAVAAKVRGVM